MAQLTAALSGALTEQAARQDAAEQALAALNESDTAISAMYEQLGRLGQEARAAESEWSRLLQQREELEAGRGRDPRGGRRTRDPAAQRAGHRACAGRRPRAGRTGRRSPPPPKRARGVEVEARLAVRTAEERANAVRGRADSLRRAAAAEREARLRAQQARARATARRRGGRGGGRLRTAAGVAAEPGGRCGVADARRAGRRTAAAVGGDGRGARRGERPERPGGRPHRFAAPRRGGQRAGGDANRAARADGARAVRDGAGRPGRRVRSSRSRCHRPNWKWPNSSRPASAASRWSRRPRCRSTAPPRSAGPNAPSVSWPNWAGSIRWRWRSLLRWRSATTSCPPSSRTSRPPARTCSTSSPTSTPASCRCSAKHSSTWSANSRRCSPRCSPAGRAGCG